eukprot:PhF_6_TR39871/c0_g1_i1/m.59282/K02732/PSMB1; 20S proteasome subunit beta 6
MATQHAWSPYEDNGGCVVAIAGKGFVIVAADTRLSEGYSIYTRDDTSKVFRLGPTTLLASTGMQADRIALQQHLKFKLEWYQFNNHGHRAGTQAIAQMLSNTLYGRRFFPYYTFNVVAGLDANGDGVCYTYDAVGCTEPLQYGATGSGHTLIEPLLDNQIRRANQQGLGPYVDMSLAEAVTLVKDAFTGAGERDIYTGDSVMIYTLTKEKGVIETERFELRKD